MATTVRGWCLRRSMDFGVAADQWAAEGQAAGATGRRDRASVTQFEIRATMSYFQTMAFGQGWELPTRWRRSRQLAGRALVRLGRGVEDAVGTRQFGEEFAETLPFDETVIGEVVADQRPVTVPAVGGWRILAPVTQRGEVIGLLEVMLTREPADDALQLVRRAAHFWPSSSSPTGDTPIFSSGASAVRRSSSARRSSDDCCPVRSAARPARSPCRHGSNPPRASAATLSTTHSNATCCTCR